MKTEYANEKSMYSRALINFLDFTLSHKERYQNYEVMRNVENFLKGVGDEIAIIISTKNTYAGGPYAPAMAEENIKKLQS